MCLARTCNTYAANLDVTDEQSFDMSVFWESVEVSQHTHPQIEESQ